MFGEAVICYLFCGGTGAGMAFVLSVLGLLVPREYAATAPLRETDSPSSEEEFSSRVNGVGAADVAYRRLFVPGYAVSLFLLLVGAAFLVVDLGRADRLLLLVFKPNLSCIVVGAYSVAACAVFALLLMASWSRSSTQRSYAGMLAAEICAILAALVVMVYSGLLLSGMKSVPLWATPWLPALFALSSLSCGIAAVVGVSHLSRAAESFIGVVRRMLLADIVVVALEGVFALLLLTDVAGGMDTVLSVLVDGGAGAFREVDSLGVEASHVGLRAAALGSVYELIAGDYGWIFSAGFCMLGVIAPFFLEFAVLQRRETTPVLMVASVVCVLLGGFALRYSVVRCGAHLAIALMGLG